MRLLLLLAFVITTSCLTAQGVNISNSGGAPDPSAGLEVNFTDRGFLLPRMNQTQRNAIVNPAIGLQVYNTTTECLEIYHGNGWQKVSCRCVSLPNPTFNYGGTPTINTPVTFTPVATGVTYQWTFPSGNPASSTAQSPSVTWTNAGTYNVILLVTDVNGCSNADTLAVVVSSTPPKNCLAILTSNPGAQNGVYTIDPDGVGPLSQMSCYCDMTTDGGGWTLVMHDTHNGTIATENVNSQGTLSNLQSPTGGPAKYSDQIINTLKSNTGTIIGYRISSNNINNRYFTPCNCTYYHNSNGNSQTNISADCRKYVSAYTTNPSPSYIQCTNWGGYNAGIDLWYGCAGNGGYTNVANTHKNYSERSGMTTNTSGSSIGSSGTTYGNDVLLWVR